MNLKPSIKILCTPNSIYIVGGVKGFEIKIPQKGEFLYRLVLSEVVDLISLKPVLPVIKNGSY